MSPVGFIREEGVVSGNASNQHFDSEKLYGSPLL